MEECINLSFKNIRQRIDDQNQVSQNFPQLFDKILKTQYDSVEYLKTDIKKIIDNITVNAQGKIEIEFKPSKVLDQYNKIVSLVVIDIPRTPTTTTT